MSLRSLQFSTLLALLATPAFLFAQANTSSNEEERLEALARNDAEWFAPKNSLSVGFRVLNSGGKVQFGKLGSVAFSDVVAPPSDGAVTRVYDNGYVGGDALRTDETATTTTTLPGGRYQTSANVVTVGPDGVGGTADDVTTNFITGNLLSFFSGRSRIWSYSTPEQAQLQADNTTYQIAMSRYSAASDGATMENKQGVSPGVELQFAHAMGKISKRTEWSMVAGIALNGINSKTAGNVTSTLVTQTDLYLLNGIPPATSPTLPYVGPSFTELPDPNGGVVPIPGGLENTTTVGAVPIGSTGTSVPGGVIVHGLWQVKGAYFMMRVGPSVRTQLTERFGLSASLGLAGAYAGTQYSAVESFEVPGVGTTITDPTQTSDTSKFLSGFYADFNLDWAANERLALFGGLSAQKFGDYGQVLGSRTARIDLGTAVGVRGGINIKF